MLDADLSRFPHVINAVLDVMPTGDMWRELFAAEPGLDAARPDDEGWFPVRHRGAEVMRIHVDLFQPDAESGLARAMVDGQVQEFELRMRKGDDEA